MPSEIYVYIGLKRALAIAPRGQNEIIFEVHDILDFDAIDGTRFL